MKTKPTVFTALAIGCTLSATAQLQVTSNGNVIVGEQQTKVAVDSLATLNILGPDKANSAGYITFGNGKNVYIGEEKNSSGYDMDVLELYGRNGFRLVGGEAGSPSVVKFNRAGEQSQTFISNYNVKAPTFITTSDERLKTNVAGLAGRYEALASLTPVEYDLTAPQTAGRSAEGPADTFVPDGRRHFGLMAQEVREHFPNLVVEDADGYLGVDYTGFIPLLIEAYTDSRREIGELRAAISDLAAAVTQRLNHGAETRKDSADYRIKVTSSNGNATVTLTGMSRGTEGHVVIDCLAGSFSRVVPFTADSDGTLTVDCGAVAPGVYVVTATAASQKIGSRTVVLD